MAKIRNAHRYGTAEQVKAWKEEEDWNGRHISRIDPNDPGHLIVFAIPPKKKSKKKTDDSVENTRQHRPRRGNGFNRFKEVSGE